jgi:hypothetical protein
MNTTHDVISDFLDGEAFDPTALGHALADAAGRDLLIDSVILRYALRAEEPVGIAAPRPQPRRRFMLAAAVVLVALVTGYQVGQRVGDTETDPPPEPTRFVNDAGWQSIDQGSNQ